MSNDEMFALIYSEYPRHIGKKAAAKENLFVVILKAVQLQKRKGRCNSAYRNREPVRDAGSIPTHERIFDGRHSRQSRYRVRPPRIKLSLAKSAAVLVCPARMETLLNRAG